MGVDRDAVVLEQGLEVGCRSRTRESGWRNSVVGWAVWLPDGYLTAALNVPWTEFPVEEIELTLPASTWLMNVG